MLGNCQALQMLELSGCQLRLVPWRTTDTGALSPPLPTNSDRSVGRQRLFSYFTFTNTVPKDQLGHGGLEIIISSVPHRRKQTQSITGTNLNSVVGCKLCKGTPGEDNQSSVGSC